MSADKDSAEPSGVNVSGKEMHSMLRELKPLLWALLIGAFVLGSGYLLIENKRLKIQRAATTQQTQQVAK